MVDRVFGLEVEETYGEEIETDEFSPKWHQDIEDADFKLNDEPIIKSGGSRMNKRARSGVLKPTGSITAGVDLQRIIYYFYGFLDNYKFTEGLSDAHTHEFWGGEIKELPSFRGIVTFDMLEKYIYGILIDSLKLECSNEDMTLSSDMIYKTEKAEILDEGDFEKLPDPDNDLFVMFYDISIKLNNKDPDGVQTSFSFEGNNNHNVDSTIGFGSRAPQSRAKAGKRENTLSLVTQLDASTARSILDAQYGEVDAVEPTKCKILKVPLQITVKLCELPDLEMKILFPSCTLAAEFDMSGADNIETTLNMTTLGSDTATLVDGSTVTTDMYVKVINNQTEIGVDESDSP